MLTVFVLTIAAAGLAIRYAVPGDSNTTQHAHPYPAASAERA
jgi:hypothetical protein